jgi:hypothetical protein
VEAALVQIKAVAMGHGKLGGSVIRGGKKGPVYERRE